MSYIKTIDDLPTMAEFEKNKLKVVTELKDIQTLKISFIDKRDIATTFFVNDNGHVKSIVDFIQSMLK